MGENCIYIPPENYTEEQKWEKIGQVIRLLSELDYNCYTADYGQAGFEIWFNHTDADELGSNRFVELTAEEREDLWFRRQDENYIKEEVTAIVEKLQRIDLPSNLTMEDLLKEIRIYIDSVVEPKTVLDCEEE